ncbi:MAG: class II aldolase/adducin family protein [Anaerolineae bacterium]
MSAYGGRYAEGKLRRDIVEVGRRMYHKGFIAASDGNISVRLTADRLLITPSGLHKGFLTPEQLVVTDLEGTLIPSYHPARRNLKPSSELPMHLEAYRQRPDVRAVVHAHPPLATAFTIAGVSLARCVLPEVIYSLGGIPTAEYATPGTSAGAEIVRQLVREHDAVLLDHHGVLTVGVDVYEAFMRLEQVEHAAAITLAARQLGGIRPLPPGEEEKLREMRRRAMQAKGRDVCADCSVCQWGGRYEATGGTALSRPSEELVELVTQEVLKALGRMSGA